MPTERRLHSRRQVDAAVSVQLEPSNLGFLGDASEGGISLSSGQPLALHQSLHINFQLEDGSTIDAAGEVVWVSDSKQSGGLRFLDLDPGSRERLRVWVSALPPTFYEGDLFESSRNQPAEMQGGVPAAPGPSPPESHAAAWDRIREEDLAPASEPWQPSVTPPARAEKEAPPFADQDFGQIDDSADSLPALRAPLLQKQTEEQAERERRERLQRRVAIGLVAVTALFAVIVFIHSQQEIISATFQDFKKTAAEFFAPPETSVTPPLAQPRGGKKGVRRGRTPAVLSSRAGEPGLSSSTIEFRSRQAFEQSSPPVYRVRYLGQEWNVIPRISTIVAFRNMAAPGETAPLHGTPSGMPGSPASSAGTPTPAPLANPALSGTTPASQASAEQSGNQTIVPIFSPLDLRNQELIEGPVTLSAIITQDGTVREVRLLSRPSDLGFAIAKAVLRWRYQPILRHGAPAEVEVRITIDITPTAASPR